MPLPMPNLDDRRFQDLVDEAKRRIPHYCPEWTDHNVSDPGVTLIELFAWLTETLIYRLNQVPEKSLISFLELMGVQLQPPAAARAVLDFWLSAPAMEPVVIPASTEVSTVQTTSDPSVSFHTDTELVICPPTLVVCLTAQGERNFENQTWCLTLDDEVFLAFGAEPQPGNAFYVGLGEDLSNTILALDIDCAIEGIGVDPSDPPLAWEAWCHSGWTETELERDSTGGLNQQGQVLIYLPPRMARYEINGQQAYWVRCRYTPALPNQPDYSSSPRIQTIEAATVGGTVSATHAITEEHELLGRSDGKPGQTFQLEHAPILRLRPDEVVEVQDEDGDWKSWELCDHFADSSIEDQHFLLDQVSGEVSFGPALRHPDGSERQYGAIPARSSLIRFSRYRCGGGAAGNVGARTLTVLKSSVPYVDTATNRRIATGGRDAETLDHAKLRAPRTLRTRFRAVTAEDFEILSLESSPHIARACCIQPRTYGTEGEPSPGTVQVFLVPQITQPEGQLTLEQLCLSSDVMHEAQRYLDERRLLTTMLQIGQPEYVFVTVEARIIVRPEVNLEMVRRDTATQLYHFLNPLVGGSEGTGWPFGRDLYVSEVYTVLQHVPGVAYIEQVDLFLPEDPEPRARISVSPGGLVASAEHRIRVI